MRHYTRSETRLVSVNLDGNGNNADVTGFSASDDGRFVAFASSDGNFATNDLNRGSDVFLRDMRGDTVELLSLPLARARASIELDARPTSISADGRYLVFQSLQQEDGEGFRYDVYLRDLWARTNTLLSAGTNGLSSNGTSQQGVISANGRYVAFLSTSKNILDGVTNSVQQVYLYEVGLGAKWLVTRGTNGYGASGWARNISLDSEGRSICFESTWRDAEFSSRSGELISIWDRQTGSNRWSTNGSSSRTSNSRISPDAKWATFLSSDVVDPSTGLRIQTLVLTDLEKGETTLLTTNIAPGTEALSKNCFSTDSRRVVFSDRTNVFRYDLPERESVSLGTGRNAVISGDGRFVAAERIINAEDSSVATNSAIVLWDSATGTETLVSENSAKTGNGDGRSKNALVSGNGRYVVFQSAASDLVENDTNGMADVFVRDIQLGKTLLVSLNRSGAGSGNSISANPLISGDGRTIIFESFASDLASEGAGPQRKVFVLRLGLPDSDGDGMDDDWEVAFFGSLARDGTGDADGDGMRDSDEFRAGTNPINGHSILRVITVETFNGETILFWTAVPGQSYEVQYKVDAEAKDWVTLSEKAIATENTMFFRDRDGGAERKFYRVVGKAEIQNTAATN